MELFLDNILVQPVIEQPSGTLIITDSMREKPNKGNVIKVGNGRPKEPMNYKEGDFVLYKKNAGVEVEINGQALLLIKQSDILVKL